MSDSAKRAFDNVVVLGASSFAGRCLVKKLLDEHVPVIGISRSDFIGEWGQATRLQNLYHH